MLRDFTRNLSLAAFLGSVCIYGASVIQTPLVPPPSLLGDATITPAFFVELEELARVVDISYCVGTTGLGIQKPFTCASRCGDFEGFELVTTWNTGVLLSDSCGYMVMSHPPSPPRIILAFRGTYSVANTVIDLSTIPQEYVPYPGEDDGGSDDSSSRGTRRNIRSRGSRCINCTVHAGFMRAWQETRPYILPRLPEMMEKYPGYQLTLVGHSLGGAIAALASLEFQSRGWDPKITTFGEPRIGNQGLMEYIDRAFSSEGSSNITRRYRRVTHVDDPVPLLPLTEWGYQMHAGEIFISKPDLSPDVKDLRFCEGDRDPRCIAGAESVQQGLTLPQQEQMADVAEFREWMLATRGMLEIPPRWRIWQLFFAHRDYFWRLGLCIPGGDPHDWYRQYPHDDGAESGEL